MDNRGEGEWTIGRRWGLNRGEVNKVVVDNSKIGNVLPADSKNV